MNLNLKL